MLGLGSAPHYAGTGLILRDTSECGVRDGREEFRSGKQKEFHTRIFGKTNAMSGVVREKQMFTLTLETKEIYQKRVPHSTWGLTSKSLFIALEQIKCACCTSKLQTVIQLWLVQVIMVMLMFHKVSESCCKIK